MALLFFWFCVFFFFFSCFLSFFFFFQAEDGIRDWSVTGVQTCALPICWDTHNAQGPVTGGMANTMRTLADAIAAFHADMVGASRLGRLTLVVMSEFGRRAAENEIGRASCRERGWRAAVSSADERKKTQV